MAQLTEPTAGSSPVAAWSAPNPPRQWLLPVALAVALNAVTMLGVVAFGWPAGNVFILFWIENAVIGAWSVVRIVTARAPGAARPGSPSTAEPPIPGRSAWRCSSPAP